MSDTPKFTPGPHKVKKLPKTVIDWTGTSFIIRAKDAPGGIAVITGGLGEEEEEANAALYAAATVMYEALKSTRQLNLHLYEAGTIAATVYQEIEAALGKAVKA